MTYERDSKKPIYVSTSVFRALWLLAKAQPNVSNITADSVGDEIIRQAITEKHPKLFEHLKNVEKMEEQLLKTL